MKQRIITHPPAPGTDEWSQTITASKVPALLGISRFQSQYAAWHQLAGNLPVDGMDEDRALWGHLSEEPLAKYWLHKHPGWQLNRPHNGTTEIAYSNPTLPFPNMATIDRRGINRKYGLKDPRRFHIIECKTAFSLEDWGTPDESDSIPADYFTQVTFQMGVSGIPSASVVVVSGAMKPEIHDVEFDEGIFTALTEQLHDIYRKIRADEFPDLDADKKTYDAVRGLHPDIDRDATVQVPREKAVAWLDAFHAEDEAKNRAQLAKTQLANLMGNARLAMVGDQKLADRRARKNSTPSVQVNKKIDLSKEQ